MTTPSGLPAWTRTATHTQYGGDVDKENYLSRGMIDARTDLDAKHIQRLAADLEAVVRTCPFITLTYLCNDASPAVPTIEAVFMMTGVRVVSYEGDSPPSGMPSAARNGDGSVTFTFASSYADPYSVSGDFAPVHAVASVHGTTPASETVTLSGQTVTVEAWDDGGSALADVRLTLEVW